VKQTYQPKKAADKSLKFKTDKKMIYISGKTK